MYQNNPTRVRTREVRLSYLYLNAPRPKESDDEDDKYSATLLLPKTDAATKAEIDAAIKAAVDKAVVNPKIWAGVRPPNPAIPIHDGDGVRQDGTPFGDECKGCWVLTASSKDKPMVVHRSNVKVELDPRDIYSGMYAIVMLNFSGYNYKGKKGIGCYLGNICKTRDGEPLGFARTTAEDDFADLEHEVEYDPITGEPLPF